MEHHRGDRHEQAHRGCDQGLAKPAGQEVGPPHRTGTGHVVERADQAKHRAEEPEQRPDGGHAVEHTPVAAKVVYLPLAGIDGRLLDLHGGPAPAADGGSKHLRGRAAVFLAGIERLAAADLPRLQLLDETGCEQPRHHPPGP